MSGVLAWTMYRILNQGLLSQVQTRVLDLASDVPECRVQATFHPAGGSTMISVLYGAGCAGGDG